MVTKPTTARQANPGRQTDCTILENTPDILFATDGGVLSVSPSPPGTAREVLGSYGYSHFHPRLMLFFLIFCVCYILYYLTYGLF